MLIDYWCWCFGKELCWESYMCWSCWWMMRRSDVEVGSSPIFPGFFLAPHDHKFSHHDSMSLAHYKFGSPLGYYCLCWVCLEYLARFDNFYEIVDLCWILSEFFHHPLSAWVKHISEVSIFDEGINLSSYDYMMIVLVDIENCDPCCWEFLSLLYTYDLELLLEDKQV